MKKYFILLVVLTWGFVSCKKDSPVENTNPVENTRPADTDKFAPCNCSIPQGKTAAEEYIKATINGAQVCADVKGNFDEPFCNFLTYGMIKTTTSNKYYDNLYMIRETRDGRLLFGIFMENTHLLTKQFPYELPRSNPEVCEIGELQLQNLHQASAYDWSYVGPFFNKLKFIGDKFENGFFEGRFEGVISTASGKKAIIKDGKFRIRLTLTQKDIIVP